MANIGRFSFSLFVALCSISFGFSNTNGRVETRITDPIVFATLDTIKPGPITSSQLGSIRALHITTGGAGGLMQEHKIKSFTLACITKAGGGSKLIKNLGSTLQTNLLTAIGPVSKGDMIMLGNLVLEDLPKWKPAVPMMWTLAK